MPLALFVVIPQRSGGICFFRFNSILTSRRGLAADPPTGSLAGEILAADTLLLVVDAGASPAQVALLRRRLELQPH